MFPFPPNRPSMGSFGVPQASSQNTIRRVKHSGQGYSGDHPYIGSIIKEPKRRKLELVKFFKDIFRDYAYDGLDPYPIIIDVLDSEYLHPATTQICGYAITYNLLEDIVNVSPSRHLLDGYIEFDPCYSERASDGVSVSASPGALARATIEDPLLTLGIQKHVDYLRTRITAAKWVLRHKEALKNVDLADHVSLLTDDTLIELSQVVQTYQTRLQKFRNTESLLNPENVTPNMAPPQSQPPQAHSPSTPAGGLKLKLPAPKLQDESTLSDADLLNYIEIPDDES